MAEPVGATDTPGRGKSAMTMVRGEEAFPVAVRTLSRHRGQGICPCCRRTVDLTFHHLVPKKLHRRPHYRKRFSRQQLALGIYVCRACHDGIHDRYDEQTLARLFTEPAKLLGDASLRRHFDWVSRQRRQ